MSPAPETLVGHVPALRRYARLLTGDVHRADDLVQDTLERAWRASGRWPQPDRLRPWLLSVMHNLSVDRWRERRAREDGDAGTAADVDALPAPTDEARGVQVRLDLARALQRLPVGQREVLLLVCVEDCSYEETAGILGVPVGTVMSRLSRARAQLRVELDETDRPAPRLRRVK